MKFIHTSDWHIGRQFHNISLLDDQRHVLKQLLQYLAKEAVDALIIAGDIYDRAIPPAAAVELLDQTLATICLDLKIPVILIPGNHDSAERLRFGSPLLRQAGLHIIGELSQITDAIALQTKDCTVNFYGIPYNDPESVCHHFQVEVKNHNEAHAYLIEKISEAKTKSSNKINVLVSHCFIDGAEESDSERPLSIGGADRVNYEPFTVFDYVALGHLHRPQYKGKEHIRYSGSLLKYSFSEQHQPKGITLVEMNELGLQSIETLPLIPLRDMRVIEGEFQTILEQGKTDPKADDYVFIRLTDKQALLDPMNRLREVYPNTLQLEKIGMVGISETRSPQERIAKHGEFELFKDFFQQIQGQPLNPDQEKAIKNTITDIHKKEK